MTSSLDEIDIGELSDICAVGGSSHILKTCKIGPNKFFLKFSDEGLFDAATDPNLQILVEFLAYKVYGLYPGVNIPGTIHLVSDSKTGQIGLATAEIKGKQGAHISSKQLGRLMSAGIFVDIFLANWDVVNSENAIVSTNDVLHRIDPGGSLTFRARGGRKGTAFNPQAKELETMLDPERGGAGILFQHGDLLQAAKVFLSVPWSSIDRGLKEGNREATGVVRDSGNRNTAQQWAAEFKSIYTTLKKRHAVVTEHAKFVLKQRPGAVSEAVNSVYPTKNNKKNNMTGDLWCSGEGPVGGAKAFEKSRKEALKELIRSIIEEILTEQQNKTPLPFAKTTAAPPKRRQQQQQQQASQPLDFQGLRVILAKNLPQVSQTEKNRVVEFLTATTPQNLGQYFTQMQPQEIQALEQIFAEQVPSGGEAYGSIYNKIELAHGEKYFQQREREQTQKIQTQKPAAATQKRNTTQSLALPQQPLSQQFQSAVKQYFDQIKQAPGLTPQQRERLIAQLGRIQLAPEGSEQAKLGQIKDLVKTGVGQERVDIGAGVQPGKSVKPINLQTQPQQKPGILGGVKKLFGMNEGREYSLVEAMKEDTAPDADPEDPFGAYLFAPDRKDGVPKPPEEDTEIERRFREAFGQAIVNSDQTKLDALVPLLIQLKRAGKYSQFLEPPAGYAYRILVNLSPEVAARILHINQMRITTTRDPTVISHGGQLQPENSSFSNLQSWTIDLSETSFNNIAKPLRGKKVAILLRANTNNGNFIFNPQEFLAKINLGGLERRYLNDEMETLSVGTVKWDKAVFLYHENDRILMPWDYLSKLISEME